MGAPQTTPNRRSPIERPFQAHLDQVVQEWQQQMYQEWDHRMNHPCPEMLWQWEGQVFGLVMQLGHTLTGLLVEAVHAQPEWLAAWQPPPGGYRNKGWRWTELTTLFGGRHRLRTPYAVVERRCRPGRRRGRGKRGAQGSGCLPVLERLGCRGGATPRGWEKWAANWPGAPRRKWPLTGWRHEASPCIRRRCAASVISWPRKA